MSARKVAAEKVQSPKMRELIAISKKRGEEDQFKRAFSDGNN